MGFNRNFPRAVIHSPYALGGNQIIDVKIEQFVIQITDMMTAIRKMDIIGEQLVYLIAAHQRFLGTATQFFSLPPEQFTYKITKSRIMYLWEKMRKYGIEIDSKHFWVPRSDYKNDTALMDAFIDLRKRKQNTPQHISSNELHNANEVRLFLKCTFLHEILDEDNCIRQDIYEALTPCQSNESYPHRQHPNQIAVSAWKKCLQGSFITGSRNVITRLIPIPNNADTDTNPEPQSLQEYIECQPQYIKDILGASYNTWAAADIDCLRHCFENDQDVDIFGDGTVLHDKCAHYYSIKPAICEDPENLGLHGGAKTSSNRSGIVSLRP